jgi:predicted ATPase/class 3 adenylate cyclase
VEPTYTLGSWIKARRLSLGLTQVQLASRAGCAAETVRKIESNDRRPGRGLDQSLAKALYLEKETEAQFLKVVHGHLGLGDLPDVHGAGAPGLKQLPSGVVTFLFTDVEGSTQRWEKYRETMPKALARHFAILFETVESHHGSVFKTVGDAVYAAFSSATDALVAAIAAQQALCKQDWSTVGDLRVRMALLTDSTQAQADDYIGLPLSRAARLVAAAHGGQIVISLATEELVRERLPPGVELRDLGHHRLKGLSNAEHIFQVVAPHIPADFPALDSQQSHTTNLPVQSTPLLGREREVATVRGMLLQANVRLLTLTGPGGVGKTRLALQVAAELLDDFAAGVYFVSLGSISEPALIAVAMIQTLGIREIGGRTPLESLKASLLNREVLLVLDNFEHILAAAALVADLLETLAGLKVLVTSRAPLHLSGEHEFLVPCLLLPNHARAPALHALISYAAIQLFVERAQAVQPDFTITAEIAADVVEICRRLDGLPLAIELAAARIRLFSPAALLGRLRTSPSFALLTGGPANAPARHQTLRSAIDWSYRLLDAHEQVLLRRIAVFAGNCTMEAIESICYGYGDLSGDLVDDLTALVTKSLLQRIGSLDGEPCFRMLETIREYALERLAASGEAELVQQRHAEYFLDLVETAEGALHGPRQTTWLQRLTADHDNLRAVLAWSTLEASRIEIALRLAAALWHFLEIQGHLTEGQSWLQRLLAADTNAVPALRARALYGLASLTTDPLQASAMLEEGLALYRALGDQAGVAATLQRLGAMAAFQGDYATASDCLQESLEHYRALEDAIGIAAALHGLGDIARYRREYDHALLLQYEGLYLRHERGNQHGVAWSLNNLAWLAYDLGQQAEAALLHRASYDLFREIGDRWGIAAALTNLGHIARQQGEHERAVQYLATSLQHFHTLNNPGAIAYVLEHLAALAVASQPGSDGALRAARLFGAAHALRVAANSPVPPFDIVEYRNNITQAQGYLAVDAWNVAYSAGQAIPTEQAIKEVLTLMPRFETNASGATSAPLWSTARFLPAHQSLAATDVLRVVVQHVTVPLFENQVSDPNHSV